MINYVLNWMKANNEPLTVDSYISFNWPGQTLEELEGEDRVEVEDLIADGELKVSAPTTRSVQ